MSHKDLNPEKLPISLKEARKIMGESAAALTNEELSSIISDYSSLIRLVIRGL